MKKKSGTILLAIIAVIMIGTIGFFLFGKLLDSPFKGENALSSRTDGAGADANTDSKEDAHIPFAEGFGVLPYEGNTEPLGKSFYVEEYGVECCVNDFRVTKECVDSDAVHYAMADENHPYEFDSAFNILNEYSYVVIPVTLKNPKKSSREVYLNAMHYAAVDRETGEPAQVFYVGQIRGYKTLADSYSYDRSYSKVIIPAEGEFTCNLVCLQADEDVEGRIPYLKIAPQGGGDLSADKSSRYVRLEK